MVERTARRSHHVSGRFPVDRLRLIDGKGSKLMLLIDGNGLPLAVNVHSASPAEVTLIEPLLDRHVLGEHSVRIHSGSAWRRIASS